MAAPPPDNTRQLLLRHLVHFDRAAGLEGVLDRVDWSAASPRRIVHTVLGRPPACTAELDAPSPRALAGALLRSPEFRWRSIRLLLDAFPAKRRLFHVHVPKAAGTHLRATLQRQHALIPANLAEESQYGTDEFFERFATALRRLRACEDVLLSGHVPLRRILGLDEPLEPGVAAWWRSDPPPFRFGDQVFAVVRDPGEIVLSHVNYVVMRLLDDPDRARPDTRGWLRQLDMERIPANPDARGLRGLARMVLHNPLATENDRICRMLGAATADSAFETMVLCDIEISHVDRYRAWLKARWGVDSDRRSNQSRPFLTGDALTPADRTRIDELTGEDRILHDRIQGALAASGALSVFGPELRPVPVPVPVPAPGPGTEPAAGQPSPGEVAPWLIG